MFFVNKYRIYAIIYTVMKQENESDNKINKKDVLAYLKMTPKYIIPLITPFLCFLITEFTWRFNSSGELKSIPFDTLTPKILLLNVLVFYAFWGILFSLIGKTSIASCVTIIVSFLVGLANYYVMDFRIYPITALDFRALKTAFAVGGSYSYVPTYKVIIIGIVAIGLICINFVFKFKIKHLNKLYKNILIRVIPAILCVCIITGITSLVCRKDVSKIIPKFYMSLFLGHTSSQHNGLVLSFLSTIQYTNVDKPDNYSKEKVEKILNDNKDDSVWKSSKIDNNDSSSKTFNTKTKSANIVVIMNECFSDIGVLGTLKTNMDYMPFTNHLMKGSKNTISGYYYSSVIAGSTANTEFEFLTGDTMAFLPPGSVPYQQYLVNNTKSMAWDLKEQGYTTIGTHPYVSYGWNRRNTYPYLGFDKVKFAKDMSGLKDIRCYTSDDSYYKYLENNVFYNSHPFFSFNVTMQNHGGYTTAFDNFKINVHMTNYNSQPTDNYLSLIKKSDEAFKDLIDYFKKQKEPTIVVMFGDHQPNDYVVDPIYYIANKDSQELKGKERFERYKVPVIMWANYDIPEENKLLTSANYMGGMVTKLAGCKTSPYQNFLEKLRAKIPVICSQGFIGNDGKYRGLEKIDDYTKEIDDYRILNYYNIFG